jgi:ribosome biogenesis GTPase
LNLEQLGWDESFADAFRPYEQHHLVPARVAARHHGPCELLTPLGRLGGVPAGHLADDLPAVGDWVAARPLDGERKALIEAVLPRRSAFLRKSAGKAAVAQVVAANVDVAFLVMSFGRDLNVRRLERYLATTWESGAQPVVVLAKLDLAQDPAADTLAVESVAFGVPVHAVSSVTGDGVGELTPYLARGRTVVLLGSSGVGKSTLINRLAGRELLATGELRRDGKGRHTTTWRELVPLPGGAVMLDTPGMRELQLWVSEEAVETTFDDVASLTAECRFHDCAHETEPGCAVQAAIAAGTLPQERFDSYRKLQRELRALEIRKDARLVAEARRARRRFARSARKASY